jgi:hypothetical protein
VHFVVNMAVIAGGFATSGIAVASGKASTSPGNSGDNKVLWVVFAIGLLVAIAGGVSQIFRPGQRSTGRALLAAELLDEGWALHSRHGVYEPSMEAADLFAQFDQRVGSIRTRAFSCRHLTICLRRGLLTRPRPSLDVRAVRRTLLRSRNLRTARATASHYGVAR